MDDNNLEQQILNELKQKIKIRAMEYFQNSRKHPSDILINSLSNSFLKTYFGKVILNDLTGATQNSETQNQLGFVIKEYTLKQNQVSLVSLIKTKTDIERVIDQLVQAIESDCSNKYQIKWNLYQQLVLKFHKEEELIKLFNNLLYDQKCSPMSQCLALFSLERLILNQDLPIQELWEIVFKEELPKFQKIKNQVRKKRIHKKEQQSQQQQMINQFQKDERKCITSKNKFNKQIQQSSKSDIDFQKQNNLLIEESLQQDSSQNHSQLFQVSNHEDFASAQIQIQNQSQNNENNQNYENNENNQINMFLINFSSEEGTDIFFNSESYQVD